MHSIKLTHTDLKPENILLVDSSADPLEVTAVTGTVCGQGLGGVSSGGLNGFFVAFWRVQKSTVHVLRIVTEPVS
jgi:serine/threonine protein kinase